MKNNKAIQFIKAIFLAIYNVYLQSNSRLDVIPIGKCGDSRNETYEASLLHEQYKSMHCF